MFYKIYAGFVLFIIFWFIWLSAVPSIIKYAKMMVSEQYREFFKYVRFLFKK